MIPVRGLSVIPTKSQLFYGAHKFQTRVNIFNGGSVKLLLNGSEKTTLGLIDTS